MTDTEHTVTLLRLHDGTLIDPKTRQPISAYEPSRGDALDTDERIDRDGADDVGSALDVGTIAPIARRSLLDLTLDPRQMAVVNNVLVYTLWGLPDDEIATVCNCTTADVHVVRQLPEYTRMHDALVAGMRQSYTASAHGVISKSAVSAAHVVVSNLRSASKRMQFDAARDILDRSGHRPADHSSINISLAKGADDALVIRVVRDSDKPNIPTIDLRANGS